MKIVGSIGTYTLLVLPPDHVLTHVQACLSQLSSDAAFLYVGVGERAFWKDPNCVFRTDKDIHLKW